MRVTELERGLIKCLAQREGMNMSELVRQAVREFATARGIPTVGMAESYLNHPELYEVQNANKPTK
jgi:hypothetical protein